ncbi:cytochrome c oxidase polypeptide IV [Trametopsis cervina]|nr:cytochrome c oxidase polypeptide IV [Trametopsis cervina]
MLRAAVRPAAIAARSIKANNVSRTIAMSAVRRAADHHDHHDHHESPIPSLFPPGSQPGQVPTDISHATGLERLQVLGETEGVKVFDFEPLDASRVGTLDAPIKVFSWDTERLVGCTGAPAESHELVWFNVKKDAKARCVECGSVYEMDFQGDEEALAIAKAAAHH